MELKVISKTIEINAVPEKVWQMITDEQYNRHWLEAFGEGNIAITDWSEDSRARFVDGTGNGLAGKIISSKPFSEIIIEYDGIVTDGVDDLEGEMAQEVKGGRENYILSESGSITTLSIAADMAESYFDEMSAAWDNALAKIKEMSES